MKFILNNESKWLRMAIFGLLFAFLPQIIGYWFIYFSDRADYFTYTELVVPKGTVNSEDKTIRVLSYMTVEKDIMLHYKDVLRCNDGNGFEFTDSNETSALEKAGIYPKMIVNEEGELIPVPWRFSVDSNLIKGERCRIDSTITALPGYNFEFSQDISSNTFIID